MEYSKLNIYQDLHGWRLDGDVDGVQISLFNPSHTLDVHIKDADKVLGLHIFYGGLTEKKKKKRENIDD